MNQKTIATHFGVSVATVSKALNDAHDISPELKEKILAFAKKSGYKKNFTALALKQNKQLRTIAVVIPNFYNSFFNEVVKGVNLAATALGLNTVVLETNEQLGREEEVIGYLKSGIAEGIILSPALETFQKQSFEHLQSISKDIPLILFDRLIDSISCGKMTNNNFQSGYDATKKLIASGCKSIGVISDIYKLEIGKSRLLGVKKALQEAQLPFTNAHTFFYSQEQFFDYQLELFLENHFDAVVCMEENSLIKAKNYKTQATHPKLKALKFVGYYNRKAFRGEVIKQVEADTIYIEQNGLMMGKMALQQLVAALNGDGVPPSTTVIDCSIYDVMIKKIDVA